MAKYLKNTNSHGINPTGSRRVGPGVVFEVDGEDAKVFAGLSGVENASKSDYDEANKTASADETGDMVLQRQHAEVRAAARLHTTAAALQVVVGDDEAPYGPPTGELSTKLQEAEKSEESRKAFAEGEAIKVVDEPAEKFTPHGVAKSQVVHNLQVEANEAADDAAKALIEVLEDAKSSKPSESTGE